MASTESVRPPSTARKDANQLNRDLPLKAVQVEALVG
jgi:hypothetical protein